VPADSSVVRLADNSGNALTAVNPVFVGPTNTETAYALITPLTIFSATEAKVPLGRNKVLWITFPVAVTFASGTPTIRLYGSRIAQVATSGATTGLPLSATYLSAAIALTGAAVTAIPINSYYRFSSTFASSSVGAGANIAPTPTTGLAELDRWDNFIGVEFNWIAAPAVGTVQVYLEHAGV
jgi:hypothetical protein